MRIALSLAFILSLWSPKAGAEEIRIDQARFEDGMLVVRGEIIPSASESRVTLDGKFTVLTDAHGKFNFNLRHTSFLCNVTLQIASIRHSAKVDGCMMNDIRLRHSEPGR